MPVSSWHGAWPRVGVQYTATVAMFLDTSVWPCCLSRLQAHNLHSLQAAVSLVTERAPADVSAIPEVLSLQAAT